MESQLTSSTMEHERAKRKTRRDTFLEEMDKSMPWEALCKVIETWYFKNKTGRPAKGLKRMLRMYLLQIRFSLAMQKFMRISERDSEVSDATTLLKFRRITENNKLGEKLFKTINGILEAKGKMMHGGTIVDATIWSI
jgi:hypothetical protein